MKSPEIDVSIAKYILSKVGDKFCELVEHEKEARSWAGKEGKFLSFQLSVKFVSFRNINFELEQKVYFLLAILLNV